MGPMDAVVAAGDFHIVLFENEYIRVLETIVRPGETVPMHTHICPASTYLISWSDIVRRGEHGEVLLDSRESSESRPVGSVNWTPPLGLHTLENVGQGVLRVITTEIKSLAERH